MIRIVMAFLAAFIVALGAASGAVIVRAGKTAAITADSVKVAAAKAAATAPDSAKAAVAMAAASTSDSAKQERSEATPIKATHGDSAKPAASTTAAAGPATKAASAAPAPATPAPTASGPTKLALVVPAAPAPALIVGGRMSKIFTAMPTKEAAKVLDQMDDADIVSILSAVNDRKAGELLALLPTARAAAISKSVLKYTVAVK